MYYVDFKQIFPLCWLRDIEIVPRVSIRDCAGSPNNRAVRCPKLSAIRVTAKTIFERLVLFPGTRHFAPFVTMPCAPTPLPFTLQLFLGFPVFSIKFFPRGVPQKCDLLGTCGNLELIWQCNWKWALPEICQDCIKVSHWKCSPPKIRKNLITVSIWICTVKYQEIWVFGSVGYVRGSVSAETVIPQEFNWEGLLLMRICSDASGNQSLRIFVDKHVYSYIRTPIK